MKQIKCEICNKRHWEGECEFNLRGEEEFIIYTGYMGAGKTKIETKEQEDKFCPNNPRDAAWLAYCEDRELEIFDEDDAGDAQDLFFSGYDAGATAERIRADAEIEAAEKSAITYVLHQYSAMCTTEEVFASYKQSKREEGRG